MYLIINIPDNHVYMQSNLRLVIYKKGYGGYRPFSFDFGLCLSAVLSLFCHNNQWISIDEVNREYISKFNNGPDFPVQSRVREEGILMFHLKHKLQPASGQARIKPLPYNKTSFQADVWREYLVFLSLFKGQQSKSLLY